MIVMQVSRRKLAEMHLMGICFSFRLPLVRTIDHCRSQGNPQREIPGEHKADVGSSSVRN